MGDFTNIVGVVYIVLLIMGLSLLLTYYYRARQGAVDRSWKYFLVAAFLFLLAQAAGIMAILASGYGWFLYGLAALAFWSVALRLFLEGERGWRKDRAIQERISLLFQSVTDLDLLLDGLLEVLQDSLGVAGCSMMLLGEGGFRFVAAKGLGSDLSGMQSCVLSLQDQTVQEIMAAREPISITEAAPWLPHKHPPFFSLPLASGGEVVGIINIYHPALKRLDPGQTELLKAFACQAALAVEKARLQEATHRAEAVSTLLREMHHRIKNSLQMVADLLYLEVKRCESRSAVRSLLASITRIKSIAAVHEILSLEPPTLTDARKLAERLARVSHDGLVGPGSRIDIAVEGESLLLSSRQATALALVINELLSNCLRHAFVGREVGAVTIRLDTGPSEVVVTVRDNGVGLPEQFDLHTSSGMGLQIVRALVEGDLRGKFDLVSEEGVRATVRFAK